MEGDFEEMEFGLDRDEYNTFVQRVQSEAESFGMEYRTATRHLEGGRIDGKFEVYFDGWNELGSELDAMTPACRRIIFPLRWEEIKAHAAKELLRS